jgi:hypothetical protein
VAQLVKRLRAAQLLVAQLAQRPTAARVTSFSLRRRQVGPGGHPRPPAGPQAEPDRALRPRRVPCTPAPPPLGPHAQATRDAYKSRRHLLPYPFRPYPRNPSYTARPPNPRRRRRHRTPPAPSLLRRGTVRELRVEVRRLAVPLWTPPCLEPPAQARRSLPCAAGRPLS